MLYLAATSLGIALVSYLVSLKKDVKVSEVAEEVYTGFGIFGFLVLVLYFILGGN